MKNAILTVKTFGRPKFKTRVQHTPTPPQQRNGSYCLVGSLKSQDGVTHPSLCVWNSFIRRRESLFSVASSSDAMKRSSLYCYLLLGGGWLSLATAAEQVCMADGQCFANDEEAHKHYYQGKKVEMFLDAPYSDFSFGEAQQVAGDKWKETLEVTSKTKEYMMEIFVNDTLRSVRNECKNRNELCSFWAAIGR
jgi:hypothetical protein